MNDRRHELQQNELAIYLDRINKTIEPYSRLIAVVVGGLIVAAIGLGFYKTQRSGQRSDATLNLIQAAGSQDPEAFLDVGEDYPDTVAGSWARLYQGNAYLAQGIDALFANRDNAEQLLGDAQAAFRYALTTSKDPLLLSRGHFGLARASESLGKLDEAIAEYRETIAIGESDEMIAKAEERIAALSDPETQGFVTWFADQDFSPADPSLPPALPGGNQLPDLPDLKLPDLDLPGGENSDVMEFDDSIEMPKDDGTAKETSQKGQAEDSSESQDADAPEPSNSNDDLESSPPSQDASEDELGQPESEQKDKDAGDQ